MGSNSYNHGERNGLNIALILVMGDDTLWEISLELKNTSFNR